MQGATENLETILAMKQERLNRAKSRILWLLKAIKALEAIDRLSISCKHYDVITGLYRDLVDQRSNIAANAQNVMEIEDELAVRELNELAV